jgi:L-fuconolactonase
MMVPVRIDAHQHFWRLDRGDYGWLAPADAAIYRDFGPVDLTPLLARAGVQRTILVQAAPTVAETRYLLEVGRATDFVAGVVGWVDLAAADAPDRLAELAEAPAFRGVRPMIHDLPDPDWMLRPALAPAFAALVGLGLTFDALVRPVHLGPLRRLVERHPDLRVVIDHGAKPEIARWGADRARYGGWARAMADLAAAPHVWCKLSGLVTEAAPGWRVGDILPYVEHLVACFGPDRLMWGSDWPVVNRAGGYLAWWAATEACLAAVPAATRAQILGAAAARCYLRGLAFHSWP